MSNQATSNKPTTPNPTNEELPYAPRLPTPEEGELVEHSGLSYTTVISHDPYITKSLTIADINGNPLSEAVPSTPAPIPIRLRASATAFLPSSPLDIPQSISPCTATSLISHPAITLDEAKAIVTTIANNCLGKAATLHRLGKEGINRAAAFEEVVQAAVNTREKAEERLKDLQHRIDDLQGPECPNGFIKNRGCIPHFRIPVTNGQHDMQARFVRQCMADPLCVEGTMGGADDPIYIMELVAQAWYNPDCEPTPLSDWFTMLLAPGGKVWASVFKATRDTDDWGLLADLARFCATSEQLTTFNTTIRGLKNSQEAACDRLTAVTTRLACAQADQHLASLHALTDAEGAIRPYASSRVTPTRGHTSNSRGRPF
jgi:hypothetical protein